MKKKPFVFCEGWKNGWFSAKLIKMYFCQFSRLSLIPFNSNLLSLQISFICTGCPVFHWKYNCGLKDAAIEIQRCYRIKDTVDSLGPGNSSNPGSRCFSSVFKLLWCDQGDKKRLQAFLHDWKLFSQLIAGNKTSWNYLRYNKPSNRKVIYWEKWNLLPGFFFWLVLHYCSSWLVNISPYVMYSLYNI